MRKYLIAIILLGIAVWAAASSVIFVDQSECAYVTLFGRHVATYDGRTDAGLHFTNPLTGVIRVDHRLQVFDVPPVELFVTDRDEKTGERKALPLTFEVYVCWRLADATANGDPVDRFIRRFGTAAEAQDFLRRQSIDQLRTGFNGMPYAELVNTSAELRKIDARLLQLRTGLDSLASPHGVRVVDVQLRRFNHPEAVRADIFAKIAKEQDRQANLYTQQGQMDAAKIEAEGKREKREIESKAEAHKTVREAEARAEATRILKEAHAKDPEFYRTLLLLRSYKKMLGDEKTQLILSLDHPLLQLFMRPPGLKAPAKEGESLAPVNGNK